MTRVEAEAGRILYFDCFAGISGDMILGALVDMGLPLAVIEDTVRRLPLVGYRLWVGKERRGAILATRFFVDVKEGEQPHRHFGDIRDMIAGADLDPRVQEIAIRVFEIIARAEARVHGGPIEDVHFHEVGAVDSIIDIVGAAAALVHLGARLTSAPLPLGGGFVDTAHGRLPVPAPATLLIAEGIPIASTDIACELTTPTGAAIVKAAAASFGPLPEMVPEQVGFGAGARNLSALPNVLRAVLGREPTRGPAGHGPRTFVVEANIDDMTGEIAARAATALHEAGALDVWFEPIQMKKGRPAWKIGLLCRAWELDRLAVALFAESPTIGLRYYPVERMEMERSIHTIETPFGPIRIKVARGPGQSANAAPEFEDCVRAAAEHGVPVKRVFAVALGLAQRLAE